MLKVLPSTHPKPMKPSLQLGILQPERSGREDKFGGLPVGLPERLWPRCAECGAPQTFLAQFKSSPLIDIGGEGRALFLFQCPSSTSTFWESRAGANCAILVEASELTSTRTMAPPRCPVEPEALVVGWEPVNSELDGTYAGGIPTLDADCSDEERSGRFLIQLSGFLKFQAPAPRAEQTGAEHLHYWGGEYGMANMRREPPPRPRKHYDGEWSANGWSRGQTDVPGRPSQIIVNEDGTWGIECGNFGSLRAYVFFDNAVDQAFYICDN